ncbi:MAG: 2-C-methyl-D-erythritol 4-phosphate cytidylyltransferase [Burkholderiales bacterium]|nr:2-C-methyl-D-erythritol 4-phosphate cytidylyltransferase [Burkholderiales bacterium]
MSFDPSNSPSVYPAHPRYFGLIPAAGVGARMGGQRPKQYLDLAGRSVLQRSLDSFLVSPHIVHTYVVVSPQDEWIDSMLTPNSRYSVLRCGGETRAQTVQNGLQQIACLETDWVLVHDAARPGLTPALLEKLIIEVADDAVGGLLALPVVDTLKRVRGGDPAVGASVETVNREQMWQAQTPQMFRKGLLQQALQVCPQVTDEASAIEAMHLPIRLVQGALRNRKLTVPEDLEFLSLYFDQEQ